MWPQSGDQKLAGYRLLATADGLRVVDYRLVATDWRPTTWLLQGDGLQAGGKQAILITGHKPRTRRR